MVWVDPATGDLRLVLSKSDAFDENSMKVKTGVLRLSFDPPLWVAAPLPPSPPPPPPSPPPAAQCPPRPGGRLGLYRQVTPAAVSTIGDQHHMLKAFPGLHVAPESAAEICCNMSSCVTFSVSLAWA